jgi:diacylglycerol kinase
MGVFLFSVTFIFNFIYYYKYEPKKNMIIKAIKSFRFAFRGIKAVFISENNAKIHLAASLIIVSAAIYFHLSLSEWLWIALSISLVWITEAINTAIEKLVNIVSPQYNLSAGEIKDIAAGAVLLAAIFASITGLCIFIPKIF